MGQKKRKKAEQQAKLQQAIASPSSQQVGGPPVRSKAQQEKNSSRNKAATAGQQTQQAGQGSKAQQKKNSSPNKAATAGQQIQQTGQGKQAQSKSPSTEQESGRTNTGLSRSTIRKDKSNTPRLDQDWVFMYKDSNVASKAAELAVPEWPTEVRQYHLKWEHELCEVLKKCGSRLFPTLSNLASFMQQEVWLKKFPPAEAGTAAADWPHPAVVEDKRTHAEIVSERTSAWRALSLAYRREPHTWRIVEEMYDIKKNLPTVLIGFLLMDRFGNVIAQEAVKGSLCYFTLEEDWVYNKATGLVTLEPIKAVRPVAEITNSSRLKSPSLYQAVVVKVFQSKDSKIVDKEYLLYMDPPAAFKGSKTIRNGTARVKKLAYGVRNYHINSIWEKAGATGSLFHQDKKSMSEMLIVLRLIFMYPWIWSPNETSTSTPVHTIGKINILPQGLPPHSPPLSSADMPLSQADTHPLVDTSQYNVTAAPQAVAIPSYQLSLPSAIGKPIRRVDVLYKMLRGMSISVLWLHPVLSYLFPSGETGLFEDSPLYDVAMDIERDARAEN